MASRRTYTEYRRKPTTLVVGARQSARSVCRSERSSLIDGHVESALVNYSHLPHSGLPSPHLLRWERPGSVSELAETISTASTRAKLLCGPAEPWVLRTGPDSAGDVPLRVVRSVPLLPVGHSTTTTGARFVSRLNTGHIAASVLLPDSTTTVVRVWRTVNVNEDGGCIPSLLAPFGRSLRKEAYPPAIQLRYRMAEDGCPRDRAMERLGIEGENHSFGYRGVGLQSFHEWAFRL